MSGRLTVHLGARRLCWSPASISFDSAVPHSYINEGDEPAPRSPDIDSVLLASDTVQYLSLHPLGPAAEMLRHNVGPTGNPNDVVLNLWTAVVDVDDVTEIDF